MEIKLPNQLHNDDQYNDVRCQNQADYDDRSMLLQERRQMHLLLKVAIGRFKAKPVLDSVDYELLHLLVLDWRLLDYLSES